MQRHLIPLTSLAVENLTVGRMEPVRFIEEAGAAGFGAVGLPLATATPVAAEAALPTKQRLQAAADHAVRFLHQWAGVISVSEGASPWR